MDPEEIIKKLLDEAKISPEQLEKLKAAAERQSQSEDADDIKEAFGSHKGMRHAMAAMALSQGMFPKLLNVLRKKMPEGATTDSTALGVMANVCITMKILQLTDAQILQLVGRALVILAGYEAEMGSIKGRFPGGGDSDDDE